MRKLLYGLIGLTVVAVGAALIVPSFIDWNSYKAEIIAQAEKATGRRLAINGDLDFSVLPSPRLSADDVRLSNIAGARAAEMARLESLRVSVRLLPLLSGRIEVESVVLIKPVIELERLADGRVNWELGAAAPVTTEAKRAAPSPRASPDTGAGGIRLESLRIVDGTLIYRDSAKDIIERIEKLDIEVSAGSLSGPFAVKGGLTARGIPLRLDVSTGRLFGPDPAQVRIGLELPDARAEAVVSGMLGGGIAAPRLKGKLTLKGSDIGKFLAAFSGPGQSVPFHQAFSLTAQIDGSEKSISVDGMTLRLGNSTANGGISAVFGEKIQTDIALRIGHVDLDKLLAGNADDRAARPAPDTGAESSGPAAKEAPPPFALPADVNGTFDLAIDAITVRGGQIRDIKLAASLNEGELTLNQFTARLPGGAEASLFGFLTAARGKPAFDGSIDVRADNLRAVLKWLGIDVATVPADRLRKFTFTAKLRGDPTQVQVAGINMQLDASRIKGGVTYALGRDRPAFGARFNIDQLNLDAYAPPDAARVPGQSPADAAKPGGPVAPPPRPSRSPLAVLNDFDANLRLRIGTVNYRGTPIQGVLVDGTLLRGKLTLRQARVRNLAGTSASVKGTLAGLGGVPVFKGSFTADSKNITGLARVLGVKTPVPGRRYGRMKLRGRADGGAGRVTLDGSLQLAGAKVGIAGTITGLDKTPRFDLKLNASHPKLAQLARLLGAGLKRDRKGLGAFRLNGKIKGSLAAMDTDLRIKAAGGEIKVAARVRDAAGTPAVEGTFEMSHRSFARLMRALDPAYRPSRRNVGAVRLSTRFRGDMKEVRFDGLRGSIGAMKLSGEGVLGFAGKRPKLTATLSAGEIDLNALLPADGDASRPLGATKPGATKPGARRTGAASPPLGAVVAAPLAAAGARPGGRYSRRPLDLSALAVMDADIRLAARAIVWRNFRVDAPQIAATIDDRVLEISKLSGKMFDGGFDMSGRLSGKRVPTLEGKVRVDKANIGKALFQAANFDIAGGTLTYDMTVTAKGRSEFDMVSSLNGSGRLAVTNGVVKGFDLRAASDRLKRLGRATDFLALFGAAMGGGVTRFSSLDGSFEIRKGVLRTKDVKLAADAGEGRAAGFVDLPRWHMDMEAEFRLTEHPSAPPFGMRVTGPPDQPRRLFKVEKLQAYLLQRGIGSLLRKVIPGVIRRAPQPARQQPHQQQTQPPAQKKRVEPLDILRGLLEGLQRR